MADQNPDNILIPDASKELDHVNLAELPNYLENIFECVICYGYPKKAVICPSCAHLN